jgi:hypothetical protein
MRARVVTTQRKKNKKATENTESCILLLLLFWGAKFRQNKRFKNSKENIRSQYSQFLLKNKSPNNERRKKIWKKIKITVYWLQRNENGWMEYPTHSLPTSERTNERTNE